MSCIQLLVQITVRGSRGWLLFMGETEWVLGSWVLQVCGERTRRWKILSLSPPTPCLSDKHESERNKYLLAEDFFVIHCGLLIMIPQESSSLIIPWLLNVDSQEAVVIIWVGIVTFTDQRTPRGVGWVSVPLRTCCSFRLGGGRVADQILVPKGPPEFFLGLFTYPIALACVPVHLFFFFLCTCSFLMFFKNTVGWLGVRDLEPDCMDVHPVSNTNCVTLSKVLNL